MNSKNKSRKKPPCECKCHIDHIKVVCCSCYKAGKSACECGEKKRCCGEPEPLRSPSLPEPPGWKPGDKPPENPLAGATDGDDLQRRFKKAVVDLIQTGGGGFGPKFGPRKNEYLPYLVVRANGGDRGSRPLITPFWESPDIFVAPNYEANSAPVIPPTRGGQACANAPNTLWAHVWNLGLAPVANARVEFYWCDPTLGFNASSSNLIGVAYVSLGNRYSGRAHTLVKCPSTWTPTYINGGHECLMVRFFEPMTDPLGPDKWDASNDRHVAQRNITVVNAASPAMLQIPLRLGCSTPPGPAVVEVKAVKAESVGWLSVLSGKHESGLSNARKVKEIVGLMHPTMLRGGKSRPNLRGLTAESASGFLQKRIEFERGCDELEVLLYLHVDGLNPGECRIYRVQQIVAGRVVGGYTVVARKE